MTTDPPFRRVLVANRGEIALRIVRACQELGVESVAVYSDADRDAPHVRAATRAVRIGPPPAAESYLRADRLIEAARATGSDALHPGYGFLSERAELAEACLEAGIVFVGPQPATLSGLGDKLAARRAATSVGVPVVPGTLEAVDIGGGRRSRARREAERVGWPLLVKAAGGGGGRGMREIAGPGELDDALEAASREARAAFGDARVYLERLVTGARHVEVQLLADETGTTVALGERDCSLQRRHQKLVEEAPAPGLAPERRKELYAHAVAVARAVGLRNAATAEFLLARSGEVWFLEVNARLQVEHGVTELVTGIDLVHEQLRIAAGRPLSEGVQRAAEEAAQPRAHAIEVRISAEDPGREFAPTGGTITAWQEPGGPGVRVDSGVAAGSTVGTEYDPLLAKILVVAPDRDSAIARLRRALGEFRVTGLQTTHPFHVWVSETQEFLRAELATDFVERHWKPATIRQRSAEAAAMAAARCAISDRGAVQPRGDALSPADGARGVDGWRIAARDEAVERWPS